MDWTWITWANVTPFITAIPGCIALWHTLFIDRTRLKFHIEPLETARYPDDESLCAVEITITNKGMRPVTISRCGCSFTYTTATGNQSRNGYVAVNQKIGVGEALTALVELPLEKWTYTRDAMIESQVVSVSSIFALDSTGKKWKPSRKKMRVFTKAARQIWPLQ